MLVESFSEAAGRAVGHGLNKAAHSVGRIRGQHAEFLVNLDEEDQVVKKWQPLLWSPRYVTLG